MPIFMAASWSRVGPHDRLADDEASANATPASAPNCASRLSISWRNAGRSAASAARPRPRGCELAAMARERRAASTRSAADTSIRNDGRAPPLSVVQEVVIDEVVADPAGLARARRPPRSGAEPLLNAASAGRGLRRRDRDGDRPSEESRSREGLRARINSPPPASGRPFRSMPPSGHPRFRRHAAPRTARASSASRSRSSGVPLVPSSPRVRSQSPTRMPRAVCFAMVPPRPISRSSGCGPNTRRSTAVLR